MPRARRIVPLVIIDCLPAEKANRMISSRRPKWKFRRVGETFNDFRTRGFLKDDQIGCGGNDCFGYRFFPAAATKSDVVTKQLEGHASSPGGTTTKYGSPSSTARPQSTRTE